MTVLQCAVQVLTHNCAHPIVFPEALRDLMINGRGKNQNIFIADPANCGNTFLISPLQNIFKTFSNPSNDKYAWLGAEKAELIFLNDFRWSPEMIVWKDLLLLLEGQQTVHLPSPKNHYAHDITIETDTAIIATCKSGIKYIGKFSSTDPVEDEMVSVRLKLFKFYHHILLAVQKDIALYSTCFYSTWL